MILQLERTTRKTWPDSFAAIEQLHEDSMMRFTLNAFESQYGYAPIVTKPTRSGESPKQKSAIATGAGIHLRTATYCWGSSDDYSVTTNRIGAAQGASCADQARSQRV